MAMREPRERKERLTIYRVVGDQIRDELIVKADKARPPIKLRIAAGDATLFIKNSPPPALPGWTSFLLDGQDAPPGLFIGNKSEGAVLVIRDLGDTFVLSFGMGFHLVNLDHVERDFGLRVTLNSVDPDKLRSLDKASYEDNWLNTRNQSPRDADIFDLEIDWELDMVYAITGASTVSLFGDQVTGRDALSISAAARLDDLHDIFKEAVDRCERKLPARFAWMENVNRVKERETLELLEMILDDLLKKEPSSPSIWMGEPEIVDWERQAGYSFDHRASTPSHSTLQLSALLDYMREHKAIIGVAAMKTHFVHTNDANGQCIKTWSAYRCLYAEIVDKEKTYILRNGDWHAVNHGFMEKVDEALKKLEVDQATLPVYNHDNEGEYNAAVVANDPAIELMDKKNVAVGGPFDKIEFCDLVRSGRDLIHVKYYRSSATLSHLFAQGMVSAETFVKHEEFRRKLNDKLPRSVRLADTAAIPNARDYRIVYAIATSKDIPVELPFFSKITLKNALLSLQTLGFRVAIARIEVDPVLLNTKKFKTSRPRRKRASPASAVALV